MSARERFSIAKQMAIVSRPEASGTVILLRCVNSLRVENNSQLSVSCRCSCFIYCAVAPFVVIFTRILLGTLVSRCLGPVS